METAIARTEPPPEPDPMQYILDMVKDLTSDEQALVIAYARILKSRRNL